MIEQTGTVVAVEGEHVWVESAPRSACGQCAARAGCGTSVLAQILGRRRPRLKVVNALRVGVGDELMLGVDEAAVLRGSVAAYLVPLLLMLSMAVIAASLGRNIEFGEEAGALVGAILGLALGVAWLRRHARRARGDRRYQPIILRLVGKAGQAGETDKRRVVAPGRILNE